jgi:hypothetical protein
VQIRSQEPTINLELINQDEEVVRTLVPTVKTNYVNVENEFAIEVIDNGSNQSRIYFAAFDEIPIDLVAGESNVEIVNSGEPTLDGSYLVFDIQLEASTNRQYIVINKEYTYGGNTITFATGIFRISVVDFNIYESIVDFTTVSEGLYYLKTYLQGFESDTAHWSEPIRVKNAFKDTLKINYSNFDNAYDIDYTTGIVNTIRPECIMFKRLPAVDNTVIRNTDNSIQILRSKPRRKFEIQFVMLPPYLMEKLAMALSHDVVTINGVEFVCEEGLGEPEYLDRFGLGSATAIVEQKNWFNNFNTNDLGGLESDQDLIIANDGFIKR